MAGKTIKNAKQIQAKSRTHTITQTGPHTFNAKSGSSGNDYTVTLIPGGARCTCRWGKHRPYRNGGNGKSGCSHVTSTFDFLEAQKGRRVSAWTDPAQAARQHRPTRNIGDSVILTSRKVMA